MSKYYSEQLDRNIREALLKPSVAEWRTKINSLPSSKHLEEELGWHKEALQGFPYNGDWPFYFDATMSLHNLPNEAKNKLLAECLNYITLKASMLVDGKSAFKNVNDVENFLKEMEDMLEI